MELGQDPRNTGPIRGSFLRLMVSCCTHELLVFDRKEATLEGRNLCTERRPRDACGQFASRRGAAIGDLSFGMKRAICKGILAASVIAACAKCQGQSNVYSLSIYSGGVSYSTIWVVGSPPMQFGVERCSFVTDAKGHAISVDAPRAVWLGAKEHIRTNVLLGPVSFRLPLPPWATGILAVIAVSALGRISVGRHPRRAPSR